MKHCEPMDRLPGEGVRFQQFQRCSSLFASALRQPILRTEIWFSTLEPSSPESSDFRERKRRMCSHQHKDLAGHEIKHGGYTWYNVYMCIDPKYVHPVRLCTPFCCYEYIRVQEYTRCCCCLLAGGCRLSAVGCRSSVVGCRFGGLLSVVGCPFVDCHLLFLLFVFCWLLVAGC